MNVRTVQRQLAALLPEARPSGEGEGTLELASSSIDAPRLISATVLEGETLRARLVAGDAVEGFRAFLDGTQRSRAVSYLGAVPIVLGTVAAVIRERRERRLQTWRLPLVQTRIYLARALVPAAIWQTLASTYGDRLVDTADGESDAVGMAHPLALRDAAVHRVQADREALELQLAEQWCAGDHGRLFIDGGISASETIAASSCTVGVVKSHRTLYAEGAALGVVLGLGHRERSSVFRITSRKRTSVASWYLRLREPAGHDPMWGLVRVEVALPQPHELPTIAARADEVSRWILAEASPLALPDARWDKMVYGIRDCEEYLRAIAG